jgi:hypothetical protein
MLNLFRPGDSGWLQENDIRLHLAFQFEQRVNQIVTETAADATGINLSDG